MVTTFNVPFTLTDFNGRCNGSLNPLDFLPQKTATVPIAPGGRSVGWIAAKFPTAPTSIIGSDLTIVLVIQDVTGKEYTIRRSGMSGAVTGAIGDHFYSGMMQPLDKPTCAP
jgi:hypothetical protein